MILDYENMFVLVIYKFICMHLLRSMCIFVYVYVGIYICNKDVYTHDCFDVYYRNTAGYIKR